MHELSFAESTLELALRHAREAGAGRVVGLHLVVGELTPLEPTSLEFYWERITKGTQADGSSVTVRRVPAQLACVDCGAAWDARDETWVCRACSSTRLQMTSGDECYLESIDVEGAAPSSQLGSDEPRFAAECPSGVLRSDEAQSSTGCEAQSSTGCPSGVLRSDEAQSSTGCEAQSSTGCEAQ